MAKDVTPYPLGQKPRAVVSRTGDVTDKPERRNEDVTTGNPEAVDDGEANKFLPDLMAWVTERPLLALAGLGVIMIMLRERD